MPFYFSAITGLPPWPGGSGKDWDRSRGQWRLNMNDDCHTWHNIPDWETVHILQWQHHCQHRGAAGRWGPRPSRWGNNGVSLNILQNFLTILPLNGVFSFWRWHILGLAALLFFLFSSQDSGDTGGSGYGYGYETQDYGYGDSYAHSRSVSCH